MQKHLGVRQRQRWERKLNSLSVLSWRPHRAVVHLREPENRDAIVMQRVVIEFRTHVDDVGDACCHDLINVGLGQDFCANGNTFGHEIERYAHRPLTRSDSVTSRLPLPKRIAARK
jgi:hypothetical protein